MQTIWPIGDVKFAVATLDGRRRKLKEKKKKEKKKKTKVDELHNR